jgi:hypothetical protein
MSITVGPVSPSYYATAVAANTYASNAGTLYSYEELLALQSEEDLLAIGASSASGSANDTILNSSDLLDLSPAALNILNGIDAATATAGTTNTVTLTGTINNAAPLTSAQQTQVAAIVSEFANQPVTQETFTQIENALTTAGINPEQVSLQQLLGAYEYAYAPGLAFNGQLFTDTLASELDNA